MKAKYTYKLTLEKILQNERPPLNPELLSVEIQNHDDIFGIIANIKRKRIFSVDTAAETFAIGLKLFSEEVLKNRKHPLFEEFFKQQLTFIQELKKYGPENIKQ